MNKLLRAFSSAAFIALCVQVAVAQPVITTQSPLPFAVQGRSYSVALEATGGTDTHSWFLHSGTLPAGLSVDSGGFIRTEISMGVVTGAPGLYSFVVRAEGGGTATAPLQLTVYSRVIVNQAALPQATRTVPYSAFISATGGAAGAYAFQVVDGALPAGLTLTANTGEISGIPTGAASIYQFYITATDSVGQTSDPQSFTLRVNEQPLVINPPTTLERGVINVPYSNTLSATGGLPPRNWVLLTGGTGLPNGITLTSAGALVGTPTVSGPFTFRARVSDASTFQPQSQTADFSLFINPLLVITNATLPNGVVGAPYSAQMAAAGGQPPVTWSVSGTLPPGLTMTPQGLISGIPTTASTYQFAVQAIDAGVGQGRQVASRAFTITIAPAPLVITTADLSGGIVQEPYARVLAATGGTPPFAWALTAGRLPNGISLSAGGVLSGTPTESGSFPITVRVRDNGDPQQEATRSFTLVIDLGSPLITTENLPPVQELANYSYTLTAAGGLPPYTFSIASGFLPPGLSLLPTGQIVGSTATPGTSGVTFRVTDQRGRSSQRSYSVVVSPREPTTPRLEIATTSLPDATVGRVYGMVLQARGGQSPYTWGIAGLPSGLEGNTSGEIIGTPTRAGTFPIQITLSDDAGGRASVTLNLVVRPSAVVITTERAPDGRVGEAYSASFAATGGVAPYTFSLAGAGVPPGLTFNSAGVLSGTPTEAGTFNFTVQAMDVNRVLGTRDFSITIAPARLTITTTTLAAGSVNVPYSAGLAAVGGRAPYRWSISGLPEGLAVNADSGAITGTPARTGSFPVTAQVSDRDNATASRNFTIEITSGLTITTTSVGAFLIDVPVSTSLAAVGGSQPYTWSITGGSLPSGVSLSPEGALTGVPTATGPFTFTAQVRDQNNQTATRSFSGTVGTRLTITTTSAPAATVGVAYNLGLAATGGIPPYRWVTTGNLPPGLSISAEGLVTGTPTTAGTFNFTAVVTDSGSPARIEQRGLSIVVGLPQLSGLTVVLPANPQPQQQPNIGVTIDRAFPAEIAGTLTLTFAPNAANNADDPFIQFSTGGRSVPFTIPAGQTQAVFRVPSVGIQTGTTAGTITVATTLTSGGSSINCNCELTRTIVIPRGAPVITGVRLQRTSTGFTATVTGFSTSRDVTQGTFRFAGTNLQTTELTVPLTPAFTSWFTSGPSQQFGGQFTMTLPFTIQGDSSSVTSVTVVLSNAAGASQPASASF